MQCANVIAGLDLVRGPPKHQSCRAPSAPERTTLEVADARGDRHQPRSTKDLVNRPGASGATPLGDAGPHGWSPTLPNVPGRLAVSVAWFNISTKTTDQNPSSQRPKLRQAGFAMARLEQRDLQTEDLPTVTIVSPSAQAGVAGARDRVGAVAYLQLGEDVAHVVAHCFG